MKMIRQTLGVFALMMVCVSIAKAQQWLGTTTESGNIYRTGKIGIGTATSAEDLLIKRTAASARLSVWSEHDTGLASVLAGYKNLGRYIYMGYMNPNYNDPNHTAFKPSSGVLYTGAANGMNLISTSYLSLFVGGTNTSDERLRIINGNIGIGSGAIANPDKTLSIDGEIGFFRRDNNGNPTSNYSIGFINYANNSFNIGTTSMADAIRFQNNTGKATRMIITQNGNIGIGGQATENPDKTLAIDGEIGFYRNDVDPTNVSAGFINYAGGSFNIGTTSISDPIKFQNNTGKTTRMIITTDGKVGIGTETPDTDAIFTVKGKTNAREVKVHIDAGKDIVFQNNYNLMPLEQVEAFIQQNKHLPEVAPARVMEKEGLELGKFNMMLLQKVEELTLHTIAQEKKIKQLEKEKQQKEASIQTLQQQMLKLLERVEKLEKNK
ncbi:MAG TPA: hypothetical protein DCS93_21080 [Microscillaceae bacterium]|nr:hypothetical protein [Microscillaceae bacterium]